MNLGLSEEEQGGWAYYDCTDCNHPFCGGKISCAEEFDLDPSTMICPGCSWASEADDNRCFEHGMDYAIFKCDFCCGPATYACGSHHYCWFCHDHGGYQNPTPCPGGKKCPLGMPHPPPIQASHMSNRVVGYVIGCRKCDNPSAPIEHKSYNINPFLEQDNGNAVEMFDYKKAKAAKDALLEADCEQEEDSYDPEIGYLPGRGGHLFDDNFANRLVQDLKVVEEDDDDDSDYGLLGGHLFDDRFDHEDADDEVDSEEQFEGFELFEEQRGYLPLGGALFDDDSESDTEGYLPLGGHLFDDSDADSTDSEDDSIDYSGEPNDLNFCVEEKRGKPLDNQYAPMPIIQLLPLPPLMVA
jgi:hypothetical protein